MRISLVVLFATSIASAFAMLESRVELPGKSFRLCTPGQTVVFTESRALQPAHRLAKLPAILSLATPQTFLAFA